MAFGSIFFRILGPFFHSFIPWLRVFGSGDGVRVTFVPRRPALSDNGRAKALNWCLQ